MFRTLVKTAALAVEDQTVPVRYFEVRTLRGARRYSAEILLGPGDRIILDDDSVTNLEARTAVPRAGDAVQPDAGGPRDGGLAGDPHERERSDGRGDGLPLRCSHCQGSMSVKCGERGLRRAGGSARVTCEEAPRL